MKTKFNLLGMTLAAVLGCVAVSCSNDTLTAPDGQPVTDANSIAIAPAKTPDFKVYSGSTVLGTTFTSEAKTRAAVNVNGNYFKIQDWSEKNDWMHETYPVLYQYFDNAPAKTDRDEQVSQDEYDYVMNYIKTHPDEGGTECSLTTYFIQNVGSSNDSYTVEYIDGEGNVHHTADVVGGNHMDFLQLGEWHFYDYNAHWGPRALCVDIPVIPSTYHETYGTEDQTKENAYKYYYIEYNGKTCCYLCFDYRTKKYDNGQLDFMGDGVYNDWVIKLIPADGSDAVAPTPGVEPDPVVEPTVGEVEVNLSVNDEKAVDDYIATKLSIHVRDTTDVEVFIPVPANYYCDADDMNIVLSHALEVELHGTNSTSMTYDVNGHEVGITVTYELTGIRVTTSGINADVLKYLRTTYGDGITFEVWNYYKATKEDNSPVTRAELKPMLDASTVNFTTQPAQYINAFAKLNDAKNEWDCQVAPVPTFAAVRTNDGVKDYNVIYTK